VRAGLVAAVAFPAFVGAEATRRIDVVHRHPTASAVVWPGTSDRTAARKMRPFPAMGSVKAPERLPWLDALLAAACLTHGR
jgi:hypothetical protein